ncbi:Ig-like domain-containing protein [Pluralibacter gergoviae]|uniref:Ig-like domain-containing protein n=1 Tax=Pluralibacter gergoviae TaxID=61647 RepID=A0AAW8HMP1_PLUGE|nr:Ig-like domain-containing protein [Pluralibacter gergoviae]AIQ99705.1 hypothetical protein LG71_07275 [Pluralibacter gergoviae]AVR02513.1 hypothetical protein A8H26_07240 [Pluralibacter gergoviae]ELG9930154.1 Ig-like domain-containing protein [Pluralibacter gergoviae]ELK5593105.1 Ig-like domain-containing protein [Pluralibacter gergoviae]ELO7477619.1 Ig-like domain-containing protein [Pluralibacter gergoviae]
MDKSTTIKPVANPVVTTIELTSDSNDWCTNWKDEVSKRFYVRVKDEAGKVMSGITVNLTSNIPALSLKPVATPPTNEKGLAILLYTLSGPAGFYQITAAAVTPPSEPGQHLSTTAQTSAVLPLEMKNTTLPAPRIPAALDGVIDDNDYANSVVASVIAPDLRKGDQVFLLWGDNEMQQTATRDDQYYPFFLTGPDITPDELLFQNQSYLVRGFVVDPAGNGHYSEATEVLVARVNGGGGLPYCTPLDIPAGDDGFINRSDVGNGVEIVIENSRIYYNGESDPVDIPQQLTDEKTTAVSINLVAHNKAGQTINTLNIPVPIPVPVEGDPSKYIYRDSKDDQEPKPLHDFLMAIGEGSIRATYNVTNEGKTYTTIEERVYEVDVIPPGGL